MKKFGLKRPHKHHTYQACHGRLSSQQKITYGYLHLVLSYNTRKIFENCGLANLITDHVHRPHPYYCSVHIEDIVNNNFLKALG